MEEIIICEKQPDRDPTKRPYLSVSMRTNSQIPASFVNTVRRSVKLARFDHLSVFDASDATVKVPKRRFFVSVVVREPRNASVTVIYSVSCCGLETWHLFLYLDLIIYLINDLFL